MTDEKFEIKWQELQQYVPFLQKIINTLKRQMKDRPRAVQLEKMEMLHQLLTKRDKTKLKYETLIKCETLLNKIYNKVEKLPPKSPVKVGPAEVVEILEPDSPPPSSNNNEEYRPPIEIPTEREEPTETKTKNTKQILSNANSNNNTDTKIVISNELSLEELIKQRELLENKIFNCNQSNSNSNSSNDVTIINDSVIVTTGSDNAPEIKNQNVTSKNLEESLPSSNIIISLNKSTTSIPSIKSQQQLSFPNSGNLSTIGKQQTQTQQHSSPIWKDDFNEKQRLNTPSPLDDDVKKIRNKKLELWSRNSEKSNDRNRSPTSPYKHKFDEQQNTKTKTAHTSVVISNVPTQQQKSLSPDWDDENSNSSATHISTTKHQQNNQKTKSNQSCSSSNEETSNSTHKTHPSIFISNVPKQPQSRSSSPDWDADYEEERLKTRKNNKKTENTKVYDSISLSSIDSPSSNCEEVGFEKYEDHNQKIDRPIPNRQYSKSSSSSYQRNIHDTSRDKFLQNKDITPIEKKKDEDFYKKLNRSFPSSVRDDIENRNKFLKQKYNRSTDDEISSISRLSPPPSLTCATKFLDEIESGESSSLSPIDSAESTNQSFSRRVKILTGDELKIQIHKEPLKIQKSKTEEEDMTKINIRSQKSSSKCLKTDDFKISIQNDKFKLQKSKNSATAVVEESLKKNNKSVSTPSIVDVLKSPPLSANDIDDLLHDSGRSTPKETSNTTEKSDLNEVRKKLAKISTKLSNQITINMTENKNKDSSTSIGSPDHNSSSTLDGGGTSADRLALKYHPHVKKNSNGADNNITLLNRSEKISISDSHHNIVKNVPLASNPVINNSNNVINTFPAVNLNDPRLRNKPISQDNVSILNEKFSSINKPQTSINLGQNHSNVSFGKPIPSLLSKIIPPPQMDDIPQQPNIKIKFPSNLIDIPLQVNIPLSGSSALQTPAYQPQQSIPIVTIPKATFSDFLNNKNHLTHTSHISGNNQQHITGGNSGYNKINPLLNDNFERQKYFESKKSKVIIPSDELFSTHLSKLQNSQPKTYGEYRRKCELERNKVSRFDNSKSANSNNIIIDTNSSTTIEQNKSNETHSSDTCNSNSTSNIDDHPTTSNIQNQNKDPRLLNSKAGVKPIQKRRDSLILKNESDKHSKLPSSSSSNHEIHCNKTTSTTPASSTAFGSIAKFKIPKKHKDEKDENNIKEELKTEEKFENQKNNNSKPEQQKPPEENIENENIKSEKNFMNDETVNENNEKSESNNLNIEQNIELTSTTEQGQNHLKRKRKFTTLKTDIDSSTKKIGGRRQSFGAASAISKETTKTNKIENETVHIRARRKSMSSAADENLVNNTKIDDSKLNQNLNAEKEILLDKINQSFDSNLNSTINNKEDNESLRSFDTTTDDASISSVGGMGAGTAAVNFKSKRSKRQNNYYYYEVAPEPIDHSKLSIENIIQGKRRSRSTVNLNESSLAPPKYVAKGKNVNSNNSSLTDLINDTSDENNKAETHKKISKDKKLNLSITNTSINNSQNESVTIKSYTNKKKSQNIKIENILNNKEIDRAAEENETKPLESTSENKETSINPDVLESLLLKILDPNSKRQNLLGVLSKVCDEKKFEKIKAILEDEDDKLEQQKSQTEASDKDQQMKDNSTVDNTSSETQNQNESQENIAGITGKNDKRIKHKTELDRLNEDIRDMFISQGVLSAFGKRNPGVSQTTNDSCNSISKEDLNSSTKENFKTKEIKIILKKLNLTETSNTTLKTKSHPKRKRGLWARGYIAKKRSAPSTNFASTSSSIKKQTNKKLPQSYITKLSKFNKKEISKEKPCPKSKKKLILNIQTKKETDLNSEIKNNEIEISNNTENLPTSNIVEVFKNINENMHAKSEFIKKCIICHKSVQQKLVLHYVDIHPEHEVYISRLPPDTLNDLLMEHNNSALYQYSVKGRSLMHYRCPFCDIQQTATRPLWLDHFSTHTGEYRYKCCGCNKNSNLKQFIRRHIRTNCHVIYRELPIASRNINAYLCNICNYVQLIQLNIINHLTQQHSIKDKQNYRKIKLMNAENVPKLDVPPPDEETKLIVEDNCEETEEDLETINNTASATKKSNEISDRLDIFMPKEQNDLNLDTNLLNYMNEVSFSIQSPKLNERTSKSIVDELSERLKSSSNKKNKINNDITPVDMIENNDTNKEKNVSIVDLLNQRFQNITDNTKNSELLDNSNINLSQQSQLADCDDTTDCNSETTPVLYILDKIDDDNLDNIELVESSEQVVVPINKPISNSRADLLDKIGGSTSTNPIAQLCNENIINEHHSQDSIYIKLNEKLNNSKQQQQLTDKKLLNLKSNYQMKSSGITIIDRLNKRLKETTNIAVANSSSSTLNEKVNNKNLTKKNDSIVTDNQIIIDDDDDNDVDKQSTLTKSAENDLLKTKGSDDMVKSSCSQISTTSTNIKENEINVIEDDDDCWEDIEVLSSDATDTNNSEKTEENKKESKELKNKTILKTFSKLYVSFGKNKQKQKKKSTIENKISTTQTKTSSDMTDENSDSAVTSENILLPKILTTSIATNTQHQQQSSPISDLISDTAIPSPISTELITDPPVPLPSESILSDLNDISEILEPAPTSILSTSFSNSESPVTTIITTTANSLNTTNENNNSAVQTLTSSKVTNNHGLSNYTSQGNPILADALASTNNLDISKNIIVESDTKKNELKQNIKEEKDQEQENNFTSVVSTQYRINNLGFSECEGKIKYLCLVKPCSFLFSNEEIGLQNHYRSDHKAIIWDGYCYTCEANISSEDELPLERELKHMTEVHIKNILKSQNLLIDSLLNQNSDSNKSFEEALMANRPKITIRRLSGDLLSKNKPHATPQPTNQQQQPFNKLLPHQQRHLQLQQQQKSSPQNNLQLPPQQTQPQSLIIKPIQISLKENIQVKPSNNNFSNSSPVTTSASPSIIDLKKQNISKQNFSIKDLLESPSVPPPMLPQNVLTDDSSKSLPIKNNNQTVISGSGSRIQVKTYSRQNNFGKNISADSVEKQTSATVTSPIVTSQTVPIFSPIINNLTSGSGLKISSVSQGVDVSEKDNSSTIPSTKSGTEQLKIVSVSGGVTGIQNDIQSLPQISSSITLTPILNKNQQENRTASPLVQLPQSQQQSAIPENSTTISVNNMPAVKTLQTYVQAPKSSPIGFLRIENVCSLGTTNNTIICNTTLTPQNNSHIESTSALQKVSTVVPSTTVDSEQVVTTSNDSASNLQISHGTIIINPDENLNVNKESTTKETTTTLDQEASSITNSSAIKIIKPWLHPTVYKPRSVAQYQLRAISLYALYKCMNSECFYTTSSAKKILEHFKNHEIKLLNDEKEQQLTNANTSSNQNKYDWLRCSYCNYIALNAASYVDHISTIHNHDIFQCPYCFYRSCNDYNVLKHVEDYHHDMKILIFVCLGDRKRLASEMKHLAMFRNRHIKPIPCYDCNKKFFILRNYLKHLHDHNAGIDCYTCGICNSSGLLKKCADTHLSLVHRISVYQCIYCDMASNLRSIMIVHMAKDHPSHLLYSCVRVSPNKNVTFPIETIENSTVLANLNDSVNPQYLQPCNFAPEHLNMMNPSLDAQAIEQNKKVKITITFPPVANNSAGNSTASATTVPTNSNVTDNLELSTPLKITSVHSLAGSPTRITVPVTVPAGSPLQIQSVTQQHNLPPPKPVVPLTTPHLKPTIKKISVIKKVTKNNPENSSNINVISETITIDDDSETETETEILPNSTKNLIVDKTVIAADDTNMTAILKNCAELTKNIALAQERQENTVPQSNLTNISASTSSPQELSSNMSNLNMQQTQNLEANELNKRILEAAYEYVLETGYEGSDLYKCSLPECFNVKLTADRLSSHYSQVHPRLRQFKCPHCTCQYNNLRSLKGHLTTHKRHKYFCFLCNHTSSIQVHLIKHMTELHGKSSGLVSFPLAVNTGLDSKNKSVHHISFFVVAPQTTKEIEIVQFGDRLIRMCERKRTLAKRSFSPNEIDQLPFPAIFNVEVFCSVCSYKTKVRTNMYRHLLFHKTEVKVASVDPVNPVPCLVSNEKNFDKMINMALSSNLNKEKNENEKLQISGGQNNVNNNNSEGESAQQTTEINQQMKTLFSSSPSTSSDQNECNDIVKKFNIQLPEYVPLMRRFICGVPNCNYLTIADYMLKCHLQTLHSEEKLYKCPHCKIDVFKKNFCPEKILQHLKYHDSKIYVCGECRYVHFLKYVVERHILDRHSSAIVVDLYQYERKDTETKITKQKIRFTEGENQNSNKSLSIDNSNNSTCDSDETNEVTLISETIIDKQPQQQKILIDEMKWSCTTCKFKTIDELSMANHINAAHNIRFRYACFYCKFGACHINLVKEHTTEKHHNFQQRQVKTYYYRLDESDYGVVQENRPLWTRSDPYRVKHIRGILMEEEDEGKKNTKNSSENKKINKPKKSTNNNNSNNNNNSSITNTNNSAESDSGSSASVTIIKRKSLEKKLSENSLSENSTVTTNSSNIVMLNENSSSSQDSVSKVTTIDKSIISKQIALNKSNILNKTKGLIEGDTKSEPVNNSNSNVPSPDFSVEIYECFYCPTKNISFKVIYNHWLLHHCKKMDKISTTNVEIKTENNKPTPLLGRPFGFKIVGYIGPDSIEVLTYEVTKDQLQRLLKMGQRVTRFQCNKCWRLFANLISVSEHQKTEHSQPIGGLHRCLTFKNRNFYVCFSCGYASSLECKTAAHLLNHYEGLKKCNICNKEFVKFLDFIRHLPKHNTNFKDFMKLDSKIIEFWGQIIILFPNGLCMMRSNVPANSKIVLDDLLDIVNKEVETALLQTAGLSSSISISSKSITSSPLQSTSTSSPLPSTSTVSLLQSTSTTSQLQSISTSPPNVQQQSAIRSSQVSTSSPIATSINVQKQEQPKEDKQFVNIPSPTSSPSPSSPSSENMNTKSCKYFLNNEKSNIIDKEEDPLNTKLESKDLTKIINVNIKKDLLKSIKITKINRNSKESEDGVGSGHISSDSNEYIRLNQSIGVAGPSGTQTTKNKAIKDNIKSPIAAKQAKKINAKLKSKRKVNNDSDWLPNSAKKRKKLPNDNSNSDNDSMSSLSDDDDEDDDNLPLLTVLRNTTNIASTSHQQKLKPFIGPKFTQKKYHNSVTPYSYYGTKSRLENLNKLIVNVKFHNSDGSSEIIQLTYKQYSDMVPINCYVNVEKLNPNILKLNSINLNLKRKLNSNNDEDLSLSDSSNSNKRKKT